MFPLPLWSAWFFEVLERFLQPVILAPFKNFRYVFHKGRKKKCCVVQHLVLYPCRLALCHTVWSRDRHLSCTTLQAIPHCIICSFFCRKKEKNNNKKSIYGHLGQTFHHASGDRSSTFPWKVILFNSHLQIPFSFCILAGKQRLCSPSHNWRT